MYESYYIHNTRNNCENTKQKIKFTISECRITAHGYVDSKYLAHNTTYPPTPLRVPLPLLTF